jgi:hypothetical protein
MARRKNFTKDELAAFTANTNVEILNGTHWVTGRIMTGVVKRDTLDLKYMWVEYTGKTTRTISNGQTWYGYPGAIRTPAAA